MRRGRASAGPRGRPVRGKRALWVEGLAVNVRDHLRSGCWGNRSAGEGTAPYRNHIFSSLTPYPASPRTLPCPAQTLAQVIHPCQARGRALEPRCMETGRDAKERKLPSAGPLKIITAFSEAAFARCQGQDCQSRHLSVLAKKQKACRAGPWDTEGFLHGPGWSSARS